MTTSNAKTTSATNPISSTLLKNLIKTSNKIYAATVRSDYHKPEICIMCSNHKPQKNQQIQSMGPAAFTWHLNSLFESNGQSLNGETLREMYKKYKEIVENLRRTSNEIKTGHSYSIKITVGVLT